MRTVSHNGIFKELVILFTEMNSLTAIMLGAGLFLCILEIIRPAFGVYGATGAILFIIGAILRMSDSGSFQMLFLMVLIAAAALMSAFIITVRTTKYNWLLREPVMEGTAFADDGDKETAKEYYFLLNHEGVTTTELSPSGYITINDIEFEASANDESEIIPAGAAVRVIEVENEKIIVRQI